MAFVSQHAPKIWDKLYTVLIPDRVSLSKDYLKRFGSHVTGVKEVDQMVSSSFTTVMIPVATLLQYYEDGVEIQIPNREDMITMHKDIELYLAEWREHIKYDINLPLADNKALILALDKLSKNLYEKAKPREVIDALTLPKQLGIVSPLTRYHEERKPIDKPDYEGIAALVKSKTKPQSRFG